MTFITILLALLSLAALSITIILGLRLRKIVIRLDRMLDQSISGSFQAQINDESLSSRLEHKMTRFLSQSHYTAKALAEERMRVQSLISDISHQTKTPLANMLLYTQLLNEQNLSDEAKPLCNFIGVQAEKLKFLIGSLVKLSRLENGIVQVRPDVHSVGELFASLEKQFQSLAHVKHITLTFTATNLIARFDPRWTAEAVGNIIDNALKYTPEGGAVTVEAEDYPMFCRLMVTDTGSGIAEPEHTRIFERFYRGQDADGEGIGLGLYLARQLIIMQEGYMRLNSTIGKGATFSIFLPKSPLQI